MIRGIARKYISFKKKQQQQQVIQLEQEIKLIEDEINANFINMSDEIQDNLETKRTILYDMQKDKIEGNMVHSRSRYDDLGENPTQYFFNLEKGTIHVRYFISWLMKIENSLQNT